MAIDRIPPGFEKPFRKALGHAIRDEIPDMAGVLLDLDDKQAAFCLAMCSHVTGYVAVDVSDRDWPNGYTRHRGCRDTLARGRHVPAPGRGLLRLRQARGTRLRATR